MKFEVVVKWKEVWWMQGMNVLEEKVATGPAGHRGALDLLGVAARAACATTQAVNADPRK